MQRSIQEARTKDLVKVPAQTAPSGASNNAKSGLPEGFNPALIPDALKPLGIVMPPGIGDHRDVAERPKSSKKHLTLTYIAP